MSDYFRAVKACFVCQLMTLAALSIWVVMYCESGRLAGDAPKQPLAPGIYVLVGPKKGSDLDRTVTSSIKVAKAVNQHIGFKFKDEGFEEVDLVVTPDDTAEAIKKRYYLHRFSK